MSKDDFIKQFRPQVWDLALESFYQARYHGGDQKTNVLRLGLSESMLTQMQASTALLGKMYDVLQPKKGVEDVDRKPK